MKQELTKYSLPEGWATATLNEVSKNIVDGSHNPPRKQETGIPMLSAQNIENGNITFDKVRLISEEDFEIENTRTKVQPGDVLITTVATIGRVAIVPHNINKPFTLQRSVTVIKPLINNRYLMYYCQSPLFQQLLLDNSKGTAQKGVYLNTLRSLPIPIPPHNEQNRIATKLEELFSELDHSIENLKLAQYQLTVWRQVILKRAFEGELSRDWRNGQGSIDSIEFLTRIKDIRKERYYKQLNDFQSKKVKSKPKKDYDFNFKEHKSIQNWATVRLDKSIYIAARIGWRGLKKADYTEGGPNLLSVHSLNHGKIVDFNEVNHISEERYAESSEIQLEIDDVLLCKDGAGIGKIGIVKNLPAKSTVNSSLLVIRGKEIFNPDFLYYLLSGPTMQKLVNEKVQGTAIPHLFQKDIKQFSLVVPPIKEQEYIVSEIESQFTLADNLALTIKNSLSSLETLRQSILKKTFKGKLISQDPNDESASELVKRIQEEKKQYLEEQKYQNKKTSKKATKMKKPLIEIIEDNFHDNEFSYEQLKAKCKFSYEEFRTQLFELIDSNKRFKSRFDESLKEIKYSLRK